MAESTSTSTQKLPYLLSAIHTAPAAGSYLVLHHPSDESHPPRLLTTHPSLGALPIRATMVTRSLIPWPRMELREGQAAVATTPHPLSPLRSAGIPTLRNLSSGISGMRNSDPPQSANSSCCTFLTSPDVFIHGHCPAAKCLQSHQTNHWPLSHPLIPFQD